MATCPTCRARYSDDVKQCEADGTRLLPDEACAAFDAELHEGDLVGEYRVQKKIGEGTYGTVYSAIHPVIGKPAAIKVLNRQFSASPSVVSRFVAEARAVNQIRHRNIIDIFSFGTLEGGLQYFVMELLDGLTLNDHIRHKQQLEVEETIPIMRDLGRALDAAHAAGIIHRDLKPENVFLSFDEEGTCFPKLLDFGIAKLLGDDSVAHKTRTGMAVGTPLYMSPEQCRGKDVTYRTDIYSFGAMLHEMLTGAPPFDGEDMMDLMMKQTAAPAPPMSAVRPGLPPGLDAPVLRMLEKRAEDRPASLAEAMEQLIAAAIAAGFEIDHRGMALSSASPSGLAAGRAPATAPTGMEVARTVAARPSTEPMPPKAAPAAGQPDGTLQSVESPVAGRPAGGAGRRSLLWLAAAGLIAGAAVVAVVLGTGTGADEPAAGSASPPATAGPATATASPTEAPSAAAAAVAGKVKLTVVSPDPGLVVKVLQGGDLIGSSAAPIALARGDAAIKLTLRAAGYQDQEVTVTPSEDVTLKDLRLQPDKQSGPPPKPVVTTPKKDPRELERPPTF